MCRDLFIQALKQGMNCPIGPVVPFCHPKAKVDVYIDGQKGIVTLCCARCDRQVGLIHVRKYDTRQIKRITVKTRRPGKER